MSHGRFVISKKLSPHDRVMLAHAETLTIDITEYVNGLDECEFHRLDAERIVAIGEAFKNLATLLSGNLLPTSIVEAMKKLEETLYAPQQYEQGCEEPTEPNITWS